MTPDIAAIVAKLTPAQRRALQNAGSRGFGYPAGRLYHAGRYTTGRTLSRLALVGATGALTPLGEQVRAALALEQGS